MSARDYQFMADLATSALGYNAQPEPPSLLIEYTSADKKWNDAYRDAYADAQLGRGDYWPRNGWKLIADAPKYDNEQYIAIVCAAQLAKALIGASDAERWRVFNAKLTQSIDAYAQSAADERTQA